MLCYSLGPWNRSSSFKVKPHRTHMGPSIWAMDFFCLFGLLPDRRLAHVAVGTAANPAVTIAVSLSGLDPGRTKWQGPLAKAAARRSYMAVPPYPGTLWPLSLRACICPCLCIFFIKEAKLSQVKDFFPGHIEQAPSRGHEASSQSRLGVGCKRFSRSTELV